MKKEKIKTSNLKNGHVISICFFLCVMVVLLAQITFRINDETLAKDEIESYNEGWFVAGRETQSISLPYQEDVPAETGFVIEKVLSEEDCGKTISFLSADVTLRITVGEQEIYRFGYDDVRWFGHTPGSIMNFVDIPAGKAGQVLQIEIISPYDHYAGNIKSMVIGNRDICILHFLKINTVNILICFFIFVGSFFLFILYLILKLSRQQTHSIEYLSCFAAVCGIYYLIETKILTIFYGNQTLYSILIFLLLFLMPVFLSEYYRNTFFAHIGKALGFLQKIMIINCVVQIGLQLFNIADFMEMSAISHTIIGINILLILYGFVKVPKNNRNREYFYEIGGITSFWMGTVIDLIRTVTGLTGDLGKYSRFGAMIFILVMIIVHVRYMILDYTKSLQETADLLLVEKEAAVKADKAKSTFLASMSHEIRTPINAVLGMDEMILRESSEKHVLEYAVNIQNAGKALLALINDVLDFSKIESGNMELVKVEYQISSVINDVISMVSDKIQKKNLEFHIDVNDQIPCILFGDEVRIRQIMLNILNNGVKYTDSGSVELKVDKEPVSQELSHKLGISSNESWIQLEIQVIDTGRGIPEDEMGKLFQSFKRLDNRKNCSLEGTGLGLSIAKSFVDLMNGEIFVESVYGKGSTFTIHLPQKVISEEPMGNLNENYQRSLRDRKVYQESFTAPNARILVVDDNEMNLKVVTGLLGKTKIQIDTALNGNKAVELAAENKYQLILLDHMMPEPDGIETLKILEDKKLISNTPVIALTANAVSGAREQYLSYGFQDYLSKPVSGERLEKKLLKWLPMEYVSLNRKEAAGEASAESQMNQEGQDQYKKLSQLTELNMDQALGFSGDGKKGVLWNLKLYLNQVEKNMEKLGDFEKNSQIKDYTTLVHAIKSNLALIGAEDLSEKAKNLEQAGKDSNQDFIYRHHDEFIQEMTQFNKKLRNVLKEECDGADENTGKAEAAAGKAKEDFDAENRKKLSECLKRLLSKAEDFDVVGMEEIKVQLTAWKNLEEDDESSLKKIEQAIQELDFEQLTRETEKMIDKLDSRGSSC